MSYHVEGCNMLHVGWTKDIDLIIIQNTVSGKAIIINRWGKVGANGQSSAKPLLFNSLRQAKSWAQAKINDKTSSSGGYNIVHNIDDNFDADDILCATDRSKDSLFAVVRNHIKTEQKLHIELEPSTDISPASAPSATPFIPPAPAAPEDHFKNKPAFYGTW